MNDATIRHELAQRYVGDQQGYLVAEARMILQGKLKEPLTDLHREAIVAANRRIIGLKAKSGTMPF